MRDALITDVKGDQSISIPLSLKKVAEAVCRIASLQTEGGLLAHHSKEPPGYMIRPTDDLRCGIHEAAAVHS